MTCKPGCCGKGRRSITDLAVLTNAELSRTSHLVARLEKRGLVARHPDPYDASATCGPTGTAGIPAADDVVRARISWHGPPSKGARISAGCRGAAEFERVSTTGTCQALGVGS